MFILKLYDRNGVELQMGDIVAVSDGKRFTFYAEVKWLEQERQISPFHTFCFHSFEKVDSVPENARKSTEERYNIWYVCHDEAKEDTAAQRAEKYLIDWRVCEHLLEKRCYRIEPMPVESPEVKAKEQLSLFDSLTYNQTV